MVDIIIIMELGDGIFIKRGGFFGGTIRGLHMYLHNLRGYFVIGLKSF